MSHIENELLSCCPLPLEEGQNGQIKLKLVSEKGQTKWLDISESEFLSIQEILFKRLDN